MFLWWSKSKHQHKDDPNTNDEIIQQKEIDNEHLQDRLSNAMSTNPRPSPVSKARYNRWAIAETNRLRGEQSRQHWDDLMSQRDTTRGNFLARMAEQTRQSREQREAALERLKLHREEMIERNLEAKHEVDDTLALKRSLKADWQQHGAQNAHTYGTEVREKMLESQRVAEENRRNATLEAKQQQAIRAAKFQSATQRQIYEKRERVRRIREETDPSFVAVAKEQFYSRRKAVADDVRQSVKDWRTEQQYREEEQMEQARKNHEMARSSGKNAVDGQKQLHERRQHEAHEMRQNLLAIKLQRDNLRLSTKMDNRDSHDEALDSRFVDPEKADTVLSSQLEVNGNAHRLELAARGGVVSGEAAGRPEWLTWFGNPHDGGFFTGVRGWFW